MESDGVHALRGNLRASKRWRSTTQATQERGGARREKLTGGSPSICLPAHQHSVVVAGVLPAGPV